MEVVSWTVVKYTPVHVWYNHWANQLLHHGPSATMAEYFRVTSEVAAMFTVLRSDAADEAVFHVHYCTGIKSADYAPH